MLKIISHKEYLLKKFFYIVFMVFLFVLYFLNVFSDNRDNKRLINISDKIEGNNYDISVVALDKYFLLEFYKKINIEKIFDWEREKEMFGYFLVFVFLVASFVGVLIGLLKFYKLNNAKFFRENSFSKEKDKVFGVKDFFLVFFLYYFLQIFLQILAVTIFFPVIKNLWIENHFSYERVILELSVFKFLVIFFSLFLSPLLWMFLLRFRFYEFLRGFMFYFFAETGIFLRIFLGVVLVFGLSLLFFLNLGNELNLLILYVIYGRFWELVFFFLGVVLLIPLVEELIFRRFLMEDLVNLFGKLWSIIFSATIFSLIHFENLFNSLIIFLIGLVLGNIYILKRNIAYTYFFHSFYNFLVLVYWVYFGKV